MKLRSCAYTVLLAALAMLITTSVALAHGGEEGEASISNNELENRRKRRGSYGSLFSVNSGSTVATLNGWTRAKIAETNAATDSRMPTKP